MRWGSSQAKKYFIVEQPTGSSWTKTWYDAKGREIETEAIGSGLVRSTRTTSYNNKGLPTRIENTTGNIVVAEDITYDVRGRKSSEQWNSGRSVSYEYGNRMVNVDDNGRQFTKEYDAWGNVLTSSDPESSVTYTYSSCGKPSQVTAAGATVSLTYDTSRRRHHHLRVQRCRSSDTKDRRTGSRNREYIRQSQSPCLHRGRHRYHQLYIRHVW